MTPPNHILFLRHSLSLVAKDFLAVFRSPDIFLPSFVRLASGYGYLPYVLAPPLQGRACRRALPPGVEEFRCDFPRVYLSSSAVLSLLTSFDARPLLRRLVPFCSAVRVGASIPWFFLSNRYFEHTFIRFPILLRGLEYDPLHPCPYELIFSLI